MKDENERVPDESIESRSTCNKSLEESLSSNYNFCLRFYSLSLSYEKEENDTSSFVWVLTLNQN